MCPIDLTVAQVFIHMTEASKIENTTGRFAIQDEPDMEGDLTGVDGGRLDAGSSGAATWLIIRKLPQLKWLFLPVVF